MFFPKRVVSAEKNFQKKKIVKFFNEPLMRLGRMTLEKTPYEDLFILAVPTTRSRRSVTQKPRLAIIRRLSVSYL